MLKIAFLATDNRENEHTYSAPSPYFGTAPSALLEGFSNLPDLEVHVLSCTKQPMSSPAKLSNNIWFHSLLVPKIGWLRTGYSGCIFAVRNKLREIHPDIVHGQGTERDCGISAVFSGYPNVITIHGNMAELARIFHAHFGGFHWWAAKLENFTLPRTSGVFCNSDYTQSLVSSRSIKTWLVPNPIRDSFFTPLLSRSLPFEMPILLVVGVISPRKQQLEILQLLIQLRQENTRFQVKFIGRCGGDPYGKAFLNLLHSQEMGGWASWLGVLDEPALIQCMDSAHALLHFPQEEAFGLVVAESLARGLKLFASNVGGIRDITSGVPEADLFGPEDWEGLHRSLLNWIQKPITSSQQTQGLMSARYHSKVIAQRHLQIYQTVLSQKVTHNLV
jgi:glycosyltransferase involved in cell wall biosynthesis